MAASLQRPRIPTLLSAFLTLLNDRLSESIVFPLLPFLLAQFAPDGRTLGLLAGSYALAQFLVTPLIGALSDRYGRRPVISGPARAFDRVGGGDPRRLRNHRDATVDDLASERDDAILFVVGKEGELARSGTQHEAVYAGIDQTLDVVA